MQGTIMCTHGWQVARQHAVIAEPNLPNANVKTVIYLCLHFLRERERDRVRGRERLVRNMCRRLQCEKDSIEVWGCDVSLCQGYVAIWPALAMIRLKYKVL